MTLHTNTAGITIPASWTRCKTLGTRLHWWLLKIVSSTRNTAVIAASSAGISSSISLLTTCHIGFSIPACWTWWKTLSAGLHWWLFNIRSSTWYTAGVSTCSAAITGTISLLSSATTSFSIPSRWTWWKTCGTWCRWWVQKIISSTRHTARSTGSSAGVSSSVSLITCYTIGTITIIPSGIARSCSAYHWGICVLATGTCTGTAVSVHSWRRARLTGVIQSFSI